VLVVYAHCDLYDAGNPYNGSAGSQDSHASSHCSGNIFEEFVRLLSMKIVSKITPLDKTTYKDIITLYVEIYNPQKT